MTKKIAEENGVCTHCEKEFEKGDIIFTHWAGDGVLCKSCGESLES